MALSREYSRTYGDLLESVARSPKVNPEVKLAAFWPMRGHDYDGGLMIVGKATNGWVRGWTKAEMGEPARREKILAETRADSESKDRCPMLWVTDLVGNKKGYNTRKSAFWRSAWRVLAGLTKGDLPEKGWPSRLVWSNLMKVAPATEGNPPSALWNAQFEAAVRLLELELEELRPKRVLVMSGWKHWFESFAPKLGLDVKRRSGLVEGVAEKNGARFVVVRHPQGKPEEKWAREVLATFE